MIGKKVGQFIPDRFNRIRFNTSYVPAVTEQIGTLYYNPTDVTLNFVGDGTTLQIGQELYLRTRNPAGGSTIPNGSVVYITGRTGVFPNIDLARSDDISTARAIGVSTEDIASPGFGFVTTYGYVRGVKTDYTGTGDWGTTWTEGDTLYVSKTVAGQLTNVEPEVPHHSDIVGTVGVVGNANAGSILVNINRMTTLEELTDVDGTPLDTDGQMIYWNNTAGYFDFTTSDGMIYDFTNKRLGLGTPTPDELLTLYAPGSSASVGWNVKNDARELRFAVSSRGTFGMVTAHDLRMLINNETVMTIASGIGIDSGKVGIGYLFTAPINRLDLDGEMAIGSGYAGISAAPTNGLIVEGEVGFGTNNPTQNLEVSGSGGTTRIRIRTTNAVPNGGVDVYDGDNNSLGGFLGSATNMGFSGPAGPNQVINMGSNDNIEVKKGSDGTRLILYRGDNGNWNFNTGSSGTEKWNFGGNMHLFNDSDTLFFGALKDSSITYDGSNMLFDSRVVGTGDFIFQNGNVGIGITSPTARLHLPTSTATVAPIIMENGGSLLTTPVLGAIEFADNRFYITSVATQRAVARSSGALITPVTVVNTTTETTIITDPLPADSLNTGNFTELIASGVVSSASAADLVTLRVKIGGTTVATIVSPSAALSDDVWDIRGHATLRDVGATASLAWHLDLDIGGGEVTTGGVATIDTTSANDITITAQWNNAKAGNTITAEQAIAKFNN